MTAYETDDGEPRYGKRLSPEELAAYRREQGPEPPVGSGRPARQRRTLGIGLVLMLVIAPLLLLTGVLTVVDGSLARSATLSEDGVVYLESGTAAGLYGSSATALAGCTVADPEGAIVALDAPESGVPYATFTPARSGPYTVTCPAGTSGLVVGPPMNFGRIPLAAVLILGAGACGVAGLVTTVVGATRARR